MRLKRCAIYNVNWFLEKAGDVLFEANILIDCPFGPRLEFY
jgi:hypothetical protein